MIEAKDVHIILIGYDRTLDYLLNYSIIRENFKDGKDFWLTTYYNGEYDKIYSGIGENSFIYNPHNSGYAYGALDAFNESLSHAINVNRKYTIIYNFDVWFYTQDGMMKLIQELEDSGKYIAAAKEDRGFPLTDCMVFKTEILKDLLPILDFPHKDRANDDKLLKSYEGSTLGIQNMEEWMINTMITRLGLDLDKFWYNNERDGAPRYRYTEKYTLSHEHDLNIKKDLLKKYNVNNGNFLREFLNEKRI